MTDAPRLVVFSGLPGCGKSALADALGARLGMVVFSKDWVEAALLQARLQPPAGEVLALAAYRLLKQLALHQLRLGQPVILDSVLPKSGFRDEWRQMAHGCGAQWRLIECLCSDEALHRKLIAARRRDIPGWHEIDWGEVERVRANYEPWDSPRLVLDAANPFAANLQAAIEYVQR